MPSARIAVYAVGGTSHGLPTQGRLEKSRRALAENGGRVGARGSLAGRARAEANESGRRCSWRLPFDRLGECQIKISPRENHPGRRAPPLEFRSFFGSLRKPLVIIRNLKHHLFRNLVSDIVGESTHFFGAFAPVFGIINDRRWHSSSPSSGPPQAARLSPPMLQVVHDITCIPAPGKASWVQIEDFNSGVGRERS